MEPVFKGNVSLTASALTADCSAGTFRIGDLADRTHDLAIDRVSTMLLFTLELILPTTKTLMEEINALVRTFYSKAIVTDNDIRFSVPGMKGPSSFANALKYMHEHAEAPKKMQVLFPRNFSNDLYSLSTFFLASKPSDEVAEDTFARYGGLFSPELLDSWATYRQAKGDPIHSALYPGMSFSQIAIKHMDSDLRLFAAEVVPESGKNPNLTGTDSGNPLPNTGAPLSVPPTVDATPSVPEPPIEGPQNGPPNLVDASQELSPTEEAQPTSNPSGPTDSTVPVVSFTNDSAATVPSTDLANEQDTNAPTQTPSVP